jgi:molecular chaperone Hsp33
MMGAMLKGEEKLTVQVKGDGPLGQIVADANARGEVRGYVDHPQVHLPANSQGKLDVAGAVGRNGFIYVLKDLGLKEPYRGSSPIVSGELAEDFTYYFAVSEQTPSSVSLGVLIDTDGSVMASGGFIIQLMPGVEEDELKQLETALAQIPPVSGLLNDKVSLDDILRRIVPDVHILDRMPVQFRCQCSQERVQRTLISLGKEELNRLIEEDGHAEVVCHFCQEAYQFNNAALHELLIQASSK